MHQVHIFTLVQTILLLKCAEQICGHRIKVSGKKRVSQKASEFDRGLSIKMGCFLYGFINYVHMHQYLPIFKP